MCRFNLYTKYTLIHKAVNKAHMSQKDISGRPIAQKYTEIYIKDANKVATNWFNHINTGQYKKAYDELSGELKDRATLKDWLIQISMLMEEFGNIENRIITDTHFESEIKGLEDGFYVIIEYDVKYSKTRNHTESLLLKQSDNLEWQILNYDYAFQHLESKQ